MSDPDPSTLWGPAGQSKQASLKHIIWGPGNEEQMLKTSTLWGGGRLLRYVHVFL